MTKTLIMKCKKCGHCAVHIIKSINKDKTPKKVYCMYCGKEYNI